MGTEGGVSEGSLRVSEGFFLRVRRGGTGCEESKRARCECRLEAFDLGKFTSGHTTRVCALGQTFPGRGRACVLFGVSVRGGFSLLGLPGGIVRPASPRLGWVGWSCYHSDDDNVVTVHWHRPCRCTPCCHRRGFKCRHLHRLGRFSYST